MDTKGIATAAVLGVGLLYVIVVVARRRTRFEAKPREVILVACLLVVLAVFLPVVAGAFPAKG